MGLGGFLHARRVGLDTPYLSKEWFDCIEACVDEAGRQACSRGCTTRTAGLRRRGRPGDEGPPLAPASLMMRELASPRELKWDDGVVAAFTARRDGHVARGVRRIPKGRAAREPR